MILTFPGGHERMRPWKKCYVGRESIIFAGGIADFGTGEI